MKGKAYIPLVVGLVVGVLAIKLTFDYVRKAKGTTSGGDSVTVVRARAPIPMAVEVTSEMIETVPVPRTLVPVDCFRKKEDVLGRVTSVMIPKDMVVAGSLLAPKGTAPGIEARIPAGYRAVAVKIDESSGVAFFVKPGSKVDVVAVMTIQKDRGQETISKTILSDIEVGAVGTELAKTGDKGSVTSKSVTLLVRPEDVPKLHLASSRGKILLAMRNQVDKSNRAMGETTETNLLDGVQGKAVGGLLAFVARALTEVKATLAAPREPVSRERTVRVFSGSLTKKVTREVVQLDSPLAHASTGSSLISGGARSADRQLPSVESAERKRAVERNRPSSEIVPTEENDE